MVAGQADGTEPGAVRQAGQPGGRFEPPRWRVFVSSPSDVFAEREAAERVVRRVEAESEGRFAFDIVRWETSHYTALKGFQDQIPETADCDLVVSIFWSRLGFELPAMQGGEGRPEIRFAREDGSLRTGSEYEFETALEAARARETGGAEPLPDILVFRNVGPLPQAEAGEIEALAAQVRQVEGFFQRWFHSEAGHFTAAYSKYRTVAEFERGFESQLRSWVSRRLSRVRWQGRSPFLGLKAYEAEHEAIFFGRSRAIRGSIARLRAAMLREGGLGFLLVVGASGAGKSSLARAGLVPRLLGAGGLPDTGFVANLAVKPGSLEVAGDVFERFAAALVDAHPGLRGENGESPQRLAARLRERPDGAAMLVRLANERASEAGPRGRDGRVGATLLLIDQMEEAFALADGGRAFFAAVRALLDERAVVIVATLRSDRYAEMLAQPDLVAVKERGASFDLGAPTPADIAEIVGRPAALAGLAYERDEAGGRDLAAELVAGASRPGALPLLSFTLDRLYEMRERPAAPDEPALMTLDSFDRLGGLGGAIGTVADAAFRDLGQGTAEGRQALGRVLRRLVRIGEGGVESARAADLSQFPPGSAERAVVDALVERRLLTVGGSQAA